MSARPWMKFYPSDWQADQTLGVCSLAARGLWMEMLAIMHRATPYGHLRVNGTQPSDEQLAKLARAPVDEVRALLAELETAGVFSRARNGAIYSRRMLKDEKRRKEGETAAENGTIPTSRRGRKSIARKKKNQPPLGVVDGVETQPPSDPEARSQRPDYSSIFNLDVARASARGTRTGPDWSDPAVRRARWEQKAFEAVRAVLPDDEATDLILRYSNGDPGAKAQLEAIAARAKIKGETA